MFGLKRYNYDTFTKDLLVKDLASTKAFAGGPEPGERAPDFEAKTLDGESIRLSDYEGEKNVVLTFGSVTCPMTAGSIGGLNRLYEEYNGDEVQFLFVYVREAHPGDEVPAHRTIEHKERAAELLREEEEIEIPIIVDDVKGSIHRKYGKLPNSTYMIDKSGRVAFRALWTKPRVVEAALEELLERQEERDVEHAIVRGGEDRSFPITYSVLHSHRALDRGGRKALRDFRQAMGRPGRAMLAASRITGPVAENWGKALLGAGIAGGVITGGLLLGRELRKRRFQRQEPYRVHERPLPRATAGGEYEAVGI
jgi:peroxiredoxin